MKMGQCNTFNLFPTIIIIYLNVMSHKDIFSNITKYSPKLEYDISVQYIYKLKCNKK